MPPPLQIKSPLRYCLSCAATLFCWALWLALGGLLAAQLYLALAREVPVPDFVLRRIEAQLADAHLNVRFGRARFNPSGRILFEDVQLRSSLFEDPLLTSRLLFIRKSAWSVLAGRPLPDEIVLEGATLRLPAILSPSGTAEPLLRDFAGTLHYEAGAWQVTQLAGYLGSLPVTLHGSFTAARRPGTTRITLEEITASYLRAGRVLALQLPRLQALEQPLLAMQLATTGPSETVLHLQGSALAVHQPEGWPVEISQLSATGDWTWTAGTPHPLRLRAAAGSLAGADSLTARRLRAEAELLLPADLSGWREVHLRAAAESLEIFGETCGHPVLEATAAGPEGRVRGTAALLSYGEALAVSATADTVRRQAGLDFHGRVPPALVTGLLTRHGPKLEPYFRFGDPVAVDGKAWFRAGWKFDRLSTAVHGGRLDSHGVQVTEARGRIEVDAQGNFLAHDARAAIGENFATGSYGMNFFTHDYRMLLVGQLRPPEISGWFRGPWWPEFWTAFAFPARPPRADVDVQGCWIDPNRTSYFGSSAAENPVLLGADFEQVSTRIFLRPHFTHIIEAEGTRAGGAQRVSGWLKRFGEDGRRTTAALEYDLQGNPTPGLFARIGGPGVSALLAAWRFPQPPQVHVWGRSDLPTRRGQTVHALRFDVQAPAGFSFSELPVDRVTVQGGLYGPDLRLDKVDYAFAGGTGNARASLGGPPGARQLEFTASLKDADLAHTIRNIEALAAARSGSTAPLADSRFIKRAHGGKLELTVSAQADPANLVALRGNGNVQITGAELGEIHLFGLLSQVLSAIWLNFSSLKLDSARSNFTLGDGRVHFPNTRISGPSAVIDAKGDYLIATKSLDFTARLKPYEETRNPLTAVAGILINPLTSIFELKLSGPITKPNWSVALGSSSPPKLPSPAPGSPSPAPEEKPAR